MRTAEFGVRWGWIFDIVRDRPDLQGEVVDMALAARDRGVVALGLAGDERAPRPRQLFNPASIRARAAGLPGIPHTGELSGPDKIWEVIRYLQPQRLQHGVRSIEDPSLVAYLREHKLASTSAPRAMCASASTPTTPRIRYACSGTQVCSSPLTRMTRRSSGPI